MFADIFNIHNASIISQNLKSIKLYLISVELTTLFQLLYQVPDCSVIRLQYTFNFYHFGRFLKEIWDNIVSSLVYHCTGIKPDFRILHQLPLTKLCYIRSIRIEQTIFVLYLLTELLCSQPQKSNHEILISSIF